MSADIFEFFDLDPEELHLVSESANAYPAPLLAKSAAPQKGKSMKKTKRAERAQVLKSAVENGAMSTPLADAALRSALTGLEKAAKQAESDGDEERARAIRKERAALKLGAVELARQRTPMEQRFAGMGGRKIVEIPNPLPDDPSIGYTLGAGR